MSLYTKACLPPALPTIPGCQVNFPKCDNDKAFAFLRGERTITLTATLTPDVSVTSGTQGFNTVDLTGVDESVTKSRYRFAVLQCLSLACGKGLLNPGIKKVKILQNSKSIFTETIVYTGQEQTPQVSKVSENLTQVEIQQIGICKESNSARLMFLCYQKTGGNITGGVFPFMGGLLNTTVFIYTKPENISAKKYYNLPDVPPDYYQVDPATHENYVSSHNVEITEQPAGTLFGAQLTMWGWTSQQYFDSTQSGTYSLTPSFSATDDLLS